MTLLKTIIFLCCSVFVLLLVSCEPAKTSNDLPSTIGLPVITTTEPIAIMATTATVAGTITADGGAKVTARGVCWSVTATPTVADGHTTDSLGIGTFTSYITGLVANTVYYVRAYATNIKGTVYGNLYSFTSGGTVTDIDGNVYQTVTIGTQTWMVENLKTTKYRNGDLIGSYAYQDYEGGTKEYDMKYSWYAVVDSRKIAPIGWHVSSDNEWKLLESYLSTHYGDSRSVVKALASTSRWIQGGDDLNSISNNLKINNYSGFSARPNAMIVYTSSMSAMTTGISYFYGDFGYECRWLTSNEFDNFKVYSRILSVYNSSIVMVPYSKESKSSVRCVKDSQ